MAGLVMDEQSFGLRELRRSDWSIKSASSGTTEDDEQAESCEAGKQGWDNIMTKWDGGWHGANEENEKTGESAFSTPERGDSVTSVLGLMPNSQSFRSLSLKDNRSQSFRSLSLKERLTTKESPSGRLWNKVRAWVRESQDKKRGIQYTKKGPCQLFEDWPIPAYPEDYDWNEDYQ